MKITDQLLLVADAYCAAARLSPSRVSTLVFNDGKKLNLIREGRDIYTGSFEHALAWFSEHWPDGDDSWPLGVPRPAKQAAGCET